MTSVPHELRRSDRPAIESCGVDEAAQKAASHRNYTFLGTTQSLCPACLAVVPAKIISRRGRVYFQKRCPQHGEREDFVCSDVKWYDRLEFALPAKMPALFGVEPRRAAARSTVACAASMSSIHAWACWRSLRRAT